MPPWWTLRARGEPAVGAEYALDFGPQYRWRAVVTECAPDERFAWRILAADRDWTGTELAFELAPIAGGTSSTGRSCRTKSGSRRDDLRAASQELLGSRSVRGALD